MRGAIQVACFLAVIVSSHALAQEEAPLSVQVTSTPTGATVEIQGRGSVGRTPIRALRLPRGEHDFVFTRRGYARTVVRANVTEDRQVVTATLARPAFVEVRADHLAARGARIRVDGQPAGTVPARIEVAPGRRLIEVESDGFLTFGQWVDATEGQSSTLNVRLEERPSEVGSILVTTNVADAEVSIDGRPRGRTPHLAHGLAPGPHQVVVTSGERRAERSVEVRADAREVVQIVLEEAPAPTGSASIQTDPAGATVLVDGEPRGLTLDALTPGPHMLELTLEGYVNEQRVLTIEPGVRAELSAALSRGEPQPGRIVVRASREDAFVQIDGLSRGRAPLTLENVQPGPHAVRVIAAGAAPFEARCVITSGETCTIDAQLTIAPVRVRVQSIGDPAPDARLFVDGVEAGELPWAGELPIGAHELEVRASGISPVTRSIVIEAGMPDQSLSMVIERPAPPEEELTAPAETAPIAPVEPPAPFVSRNSAEALASGRVAMAFFLGWPYLLGLELDVGLPGPVDLGIAARTFGRLTELELHARVGARLADVVALGGWLRLASGLGPDEINAFTAKLDARVTVLPISDVSITGWIGVDFTTDAYPFTEQDAAVRLAGDVSRQDLVRGRVGGAVDWRFASAWSLGVRLEGIFASTGGRRRILGDVLELGNQDSEFYGELHAGVEL
jgi:hypothetical protein